MGFDLFRLGRANAAKPDERIPLPKEGKGKREGQLAITVLGKKGQFERLSCGVKNSKRLQGKGEEGERGDFSFRKRYAVQLISQGPARARLAGEEKEGALFHLTTGQNITSSPKRAREKVERGRRREPGNGKKERSSI